MDSRLERSEKRVDDTLAFAVNSLRDTVRQEAATAVQSALKAMAPTVLVVKTPNAPTGVNLGLVHKTTPRVIRYLAAGNNVYLHGPAGSGKTTAASQCAEAFGLEFYFTGKVDSEYSLLGFTTGPVVVRTPFREAFEKGGLFLFDEMDKSDASALVAVNAALANGVCAFPDGIIKRHENFKVIGGGNANLTGQSRLYQASQQMDASSIDRFDFIEFLYDEELERALSTDAKWCAYVQAVRRAVAERGLDHLVTPRATIGGCKLLAAGEPWNEVAEAVIYKGLDKSTVDQLEAMVKGAY
jgi:MoxR-like ATPase